MVVLLIDCRQKTLSKLSFFVSIFQYNIRSYPTTILYNNSIPHQFTGHHTAADLVEFVEVGKQALSHTFITPLPPPSPAVRTEKGVTAAKARINM